MPPAVFPSLAASSSNPRPLIFYKMPNVYQTAFTEYDDGGRDFALQHGGTGIQRWYISYDGLTAVEAAILDSHAESAKLGPDGFSAYTFGFTDRDTSVVYTGVRYQSYERPAHKNKDIQSRTIVLVRFP